MAPHTSSTASFGRELLKGLLKVLDSKSGGARAGDELGGELGELAVTLGWGGFDGVIGDERPGALLGVEDAAQLHLAVGAGDGVGIDGEVDGDAADGGELVSGAQGGSGDGGLDLVDELAVDRDARMGVQAEVEAGLS